MSVLDAATKAVVRFDDVVRTERYFTATLLPFLLLQGAMEGVQEFVATIDKKATTEHNWIGNQTPKIDPSYDFEDVEVISEFNIARDLKYASLKIDYKSGVPPEPLSIVNPNPVLSADDNESDEQPKKDVPDLVIVVGKELVVCEAKFFGGYNVDDLNEQLLSQRNQVRLLFANRPLRAYRHVAIVPSLPNPPSSIDADAVVTWDEIGDLAEKLVGVNHYATRRIRKAMERYRLTSPGPSGVRNFDGKLSFHEMRAKCREHEKSGVPIEVGHTGGKLALLKMSLPEAEAKRDWKWRNPETNMGNVTPGNWFSGADWRKIVESAGGFGGRNP